jgi:two-component system, sensor histidine kinase
MSNNQPGFERQAEWLPTRLNDAEATLQAIHSGEIDALIVAGPHGDRVYTLHSAEEPYRNLVEQMQEGAVLLTGGGDILYANARFAVMVGKPLESVVGSRMAPFINADDREAFAALLRLGSGRCRSRLIGEDSGTIDISLSVSRASGPGDCLNLIVTDLTELQEATSNRERAERDNHTKDEFLTVLAHELRNPLGAISNAVRVFGLSHAAGETATRAHEVIARQVAHISHLINDLLDVKRVASGRIWLKRQPIDMAQAVRQTVAIFADDSRLDRQIDVTTEPVWVYGDPVRLDQVLTNIMTNAVKYTPPGGRIRVALSADDGDAVLSVEDTGFGISPKLLPFIFDMYVQADQTLDRAQGGLGIGLTLVRRLVELHDGTIVATSDGEGLGSRFTVRLKRVPAATTSVEVPAPTERRAKPKRVLLIEDSRDAREMLRIMLQLDGHVVYDAADGASGLELLNAVRPDVGIIDISLPDMDGYQVAERIREEPHGRNMLLLALTGYSGDAARSSACGFDHQLLKPIDPDVLGRLLSEGTQSS